MISEFFYGLPKEFQIMPLLFMAIFMAITAAINMIEKKRIELFLPFLTLGIGICLSAGLMFYDFYGLAMETFLVIKTSAIIFIFHIIWRKTSK